MEKMRKLAVLVIGSALSVFRLFVLTVLVVFVPVFAEYPTVFFSVRRIPVFDAVSGKHRLLHFQCPLLYTKGIMFFLSNWALALELRLTLRTLRINQPASKLLSNLCNILFLSLVLASVYIFAPYLEIQ